MKKKAVNIKNNFNESIKSFSFKKLLHQILHFMKYNRVFLSYVILSLLSCKLLRIFTIEDSINIKAFLFDLSIILLLGSLGYLFKPKNQFKYWLVLLILYTFINTVNGMYYLFFTSFASFSLLETFAQTFTVSDSVVAKLSYKTFVYLFVLIIYIVHREILRKKRYYFTVEKVEKRKKILPGVLITGGVILVISIGMLTKTDLSRLRKQWNREYIVERYGIIVYQANDLGQTIKTKLDATFGKDKAAEEFINYYNNNTNERSNNEYTNKLEGYNVIIIHLESMMQFLVGLEINGQEVTPNLNKLTRESMYFDNFYSQVSVGTSSDAEFTLNTSLLPAQSGTVAVSYYNRNYVSIEKLLKEKGYYTFSMHGNKASMWNRQNLHDSLGYERFYSQDDYEIDEVIGLGLSDKSFFRQSEVKLGEIKAMIDTDDKYNNYMGTILMLSNHTPFEDPYYLEGEDAFDVRYHTGRFDEEGNEIVYDYLLEEDVETIGRYIRSVHYADEALGEFMEYVNTHDEFNKTVFVMYGDHAAQIGKSEFAAYNNFDPETGVFKEKTDENYNEYDYYSNEVFKKVPFLIYTKDGSIKPNTYSYPMGMIDVFPTIGNMLGIYNKYALGRDIFEIKDDNTVVFPNGNFLTKDVYYYATSDNYKMINPDAQLSANYVEEHKTYSEAIIKESNDLILYNLIEYTKE
ncbi:MAG: sulfatase-like hydrolase/transferase [Bacilli bacterium]|nr:sulfatase-like hydrolase/transferase [Bacilli bacterium]